MLLVVPAAAQDLDIGASFRGYGFYALEESFFQSRRDAEFAVVRVTPTLTFNPTFKLESHVVATVASPPASLSSSIATGVGETYLDLERNLVNKPDARVDLALDRLNLQIKTDAFQLTCGRQAVSWGVNYFWPALDLFAPFAPNRIDRDYKPGVDAVRLLVPIGAYSEVQAIGAILGPSSSDDLAVGSLIRLNFGNVDVGGMAGRFHRDDVIGAFVTANVAGTGLRGEASWTHSGDPADVAFDRERFGRAAIGVDRQLTPSLSLILEAAWNGYGAADPRDYTRLLMSDRVSRGEVTSLGRYHTGVSVNWQLHPLFRLNQTLLYGWDDGSALWSPALTWSTGNNSEILLGGQFGLGKEPSSRFRLQSEYGASPSVLFVGAKLYL